MYTKVFPTVSILLLSAFCGSLWAQSRVGRVVAWGDNSAGQTNVPAIGALAIAMAAGEGHAVVLRPDHTVAAWGKNDSNQINVPFGLRNVVAVAAGDKHSLALLANGTVVGWGAQAAVAIPANLSHVVAIAAGAGRSYAVRSDGTVVGWGAAAANEAQHMPALTNVVAIASGRFHTVALRSDGTVDAWGLAPEGSVPAGLSNVVAIASRVNHTLALRGDGTAYGWGNNTYGVATVPSGLSNLVGVAGGRYHSAVLRDNGSVISWGNFSATNVPANLNGAMALAAGNDFNVALVPVQEHAPEITQDLHDLGTMSGSNVVFSIGVLGSGPLGFQWYYNGNALPDATQSLLELANVQPAQAGNYQVVVSNAYGAATSSVAHLVVDQVGPWPIDSMGWNVANLDAVGNYLFLIDRTTGLHVLDISDPAQPEEVGSLDFHSGDTHGVTVVGPYAYVADGPAGLRVVDVSNPREPVLMGTATPTPPSVRNLAIGVQVAGFWAYVADYVGAVRVVDIRDPSRPVLVRSIPTGTQTDGLSILGDYLYTAEGYYGMSVLSLSDPESPVVVARYAQPNTTESFLGVRGVATQGAYAYLTQEERVNYLGYTNLVVMDVRDPSHPRVAAKIPDPLGARRVKADGSFLHLAATTSGVALWPMPNPEKPFLLGVMDTRGSANAVDVSGRYLFVADSGGGLAVLTVQAIFSAPPRNEWITPSQTIGEEKPFALGVNVTGNPPFQYQWRKGTADLAGATNAILALTSPQLSDAGEYTVLVTNADGATTSGPVQLTVTASSMRPRLTLSIAGNDLILNCWLRGEAGTMTVWASDSPDRFESAGTPLFTGPIPANRQWQMTLTNWAIHAQTFFRLSESPAGAAQ